MVKQKERLKERLKDFPTGRHLEMRTEMEKPREKQKD